MQLTARISESMVCTPAKLRRAYLCTRWHQVTQAYSFQKTTFPGARCCRNSPDLTTSAPLHSYFRPPPEFVKNNSGRQSDVCKGRGGDLFPKIIQHILRPLGFVAQIHR